MHDGRWERRLGREVPDLRIGVLGFGAIGRIVAQTFAAMGADVVAHDPFATVEGSGPSPPPRCSPTRTS